MECKFSDVTHETYEEVRPNIQVIQTRGSFKYFGSIIQVNGQNDKDGCYLSYWCKVDEMEARFWSLM